MLLYLEGLVGGFHHHADVEVERLSCLGGLLVVLAVHSELRVIGILHPTALIFLVGLSIDALGHKLLVQLVQQVELTRKVHHGAGFATLVDHEQRGDAGRTCHVGVVGTEGRGDVYDTRTVLCRHIVAGDDAESLGRCFLPVAFVVQLGGLHPRDELFVLHAYEVRTLILAYHLEGDQLVAWLIVL